MARQGHKEDFTVDVDGIGQFKFGRRQQRDVYKIRGLYAKMTGDNWKDDGTVGDMEAWMHATLEILTVESPPTFSVETMDPLKDVDNDDRLMRVYLALRQKEGSFRPQSAKSVAGTGEGTGS